MKKIVLVLSLLVAPIVMSAQSIFEKYEDQEHVTSVVVNQKMFKMLANIDIQTNDPDSDDFINQVKMLDNLTVLTTDDMSVSNSMKKDVEKYIKNSKLEELMRIKDGDQTVNFFVLEGKDDNGKFLRYSFTIGKIFKLIFVILIARISLSIFRVLI